MPYKHAKTDHSSIASGIRLELYRKRCRTYGSSRSRLAPPRYYGRFVPNISFGPPVVKALRSHSQAFFDCHLMVSNPFFWVDPFQKAGADNFTFHWETVADTECATLLATLIRDRGMEVGISIKPATRVENVFPVIDSGLISTLMVMTVEPGFGGQKFMPEMMEKIRKARERYPNVNLQVDGGLDEETTKIAGDNGANVIVAGTSLFCANEPSKTIQLMKKSLF